ncbi:MAG: undecaprenyl/decaprenyl-phosphate alpha-N-acetylglucosaminyl 1-phosphate transferase [Muribaculum sp.]|nr:undecaprenyl/decaprenyl-phosphate alpha-N-acetylglucosaminyl 1-phosphate transferase [Muribaculum sp.]
MDIWLCIDLLVLIIVVLVTGVLIPQILLIAFRKNLLDAPDPRKIHIVAVPRLGGIAFFPAILFTIALVFGLVRQYNSSIMADISDHSVTSLCFFICAVVTLYLVGMADDLIGLRYRAKFVAQVISAALIIAGGLQLDNLHGFIYINQMPVIASIFLTVLLTVFITNAINLIDGIDGLASGLSAIAFGFYGYVFYSVGLQVYSMIAFGALGALIPFFYYNVFGNAEKHGKIFMGDTGALTIGLLLSVMSIRICDIPDTVMNVNPAILAFAPLLIPCCDVVRVYIHRIKAHRNPFLPDKTHIHHKLLALGMTPRVAMPTIVSASLVLTLINYILSEYIDITLLFCLDLVIWILTNVILSRAIRNRSHRLGQLLYQ